MAEVTVTELAKSVGAPVERLLKQMKDAGLKQSSADAAVSDEEKQTLLTFLKNSHGEVPAEKGKITLKRKTTSTLKAGSGRKTVNVEVRKKRTYVKRDDAEVQAEEAAAAEAKAAEVAVEVAAEAAAAAIVEANQKALDEAKALEDAQAKKADKAEAAAKEAEATAAKAEAKAKANEKAHREADAKADAEAKAKAEKENKVVEPPIQRSYADDVEAMRQAAILRRKAEEAKKKAAQAAKLKAKAEEKRRDEEDKAVRQAARVAAEKAEKAEKAAPKTAGKTTAKTAAKSAAKPAANTPKADADKAKPKTKAPHAFRNAAAPAGGGREELTAKKKPASRGAGGKKKGNKKDLLNIKDDLWEDKRKHKSFRAIAKMNNKHGFKKPTDQITHEVEIFEGMTVSELAQGMAIKAGSIVKSLMKMGVMATMNQPLDIETSQLIVEETDHSFKIRSENAVEEQLEQDTAVEGELVTRAPVVTVMGHVDHGKTSLLDYIRETKVTSGEAGGITQHIGAYRVKTSQGEIAFLDTPGHAAFTAMRARGAQCTDVVILVVAADDGVMPQTEEAILHSKAAGVPMVVAINKCDKETADPDRVKNELVAKGVVPEDWGGDTQFIQVSAHSGQGIDELLEAISLQAELLELQAIADVPAKGVVIESRVDKGRGVVATILVQSGTLNRADVLLAGESSGRVRAMVDETGQKVDTAGPSTPVEILGLDVAPNAGDDFVVVADERKAREIAEHRAITAREDFMRRQQAAKLENMFADMGAEQKKVLPIVVKSDVRGSMEAIQASLLDLGNDEVQVNVISSGVGGITDNDINLAASSGAIVVGFNVRAGAETRALAEKEAVDIRYYSIIYQLLDDVKAALSGMLDPERVEEIVGIANVREVFSSPKFGQVAGCMVVEGSVYRNKPIRVLRDNVVIFEGELESLRRFKDDVNDVRNGTECGIGVKNYDVKVGDQIEVFDVKEVARQL